MDRRNFLKTTAFGAALAGLGALPGCGVIKVRKHFDIIITGGDIYDGSGKPCFHGDIGIKDGVIKAIGHNLGYSADWIVNAEGLAVSPGFIDIHSHTDTNLFLAPKGESRIFQGITTEVGGNCGDAPFVFSDTAWEKRSKGTVLGHKAWRDVDGFFSELRTQQIGINYTSLVGHGDLRRAVVGPYNVKATDEQVARMCDILDYELGLGAAGLSFGLEYAPGCYCDTREMVELCKVVARHDKLYSIHMRNEDAFVLEAIEEAVEAARQSGARLEISHLKAQNPANFDKLPAMLAKIDAAHAEGIDIAFDRYPYTAFSTSLKTMVPSELRDGTNEDIMKRLKDPGTASQIARHIRSRLAAYGGADKVVIAECRNADNKAFSGKSIAECCRISGMEEGEMVVHLLISENLSVNQATFAMDEGNLKTLYSHPLSMPGSDGAVYSPEGPLSESLPHPRAYGTFPRFLGKYCREEKAVDLPEAVRKCTGLPASRLKLKDRGLLMPGYAADITVFNPQTIIDKATFADPHVFAEGITHVIVNGVPAIRHGEHTGKLAGTTL